MKVIIIGAVAAGTKAAVKLKKLKPEFKIQIYTQEKNISYSSCGLPYFIEGNFADINKLIIRTPEEFEEKGINVNILHRVERINIKEKKVLVRNLQTQETFFDNYDKLVIATGARPFFPKIKNNNLENIFTLRTLEDGMKIRNKLLQSKKAIIIGAGYTAMELLEAFTKNKVHTTLIEFSPYIMNKFDKDMSKQIEEQVLFMSPDLIKIITSDEVEEFLGTKQVEGIKTKKGLKIEADMIIISMGVIPNSEIAKECGIKLGKNNSIKVDKKMRTNKKDIYACGDCAEKTNIITKTKMWIPLGSTANKEGRCAALNIAGIEDKFEGILGSAVTKYFNFTMSRTGICEETTLKTGYNPVSVIINKRDKASYIKGVQKITLKLIADKITHRILGAQAIGYGDADKRINTITTGLLKGIKAEELLEDDITYSPHFSPSIDPVLIAARELSKKLNNP